MIRIATLIVTFNGEKWIERCVNSLLTSQLKTDIFVVDNNSNDNTLSLLRQFPDVNLIKLEENIGFGAANNRGIGEIFELGQYQYIFLLNQDVYVSEITISTLFKSAITNPEFLILSPIHLDSTGENLDKGFIYGIKNEFVLESLILGEGKNKPIKVEFIPAAAWFCDIKVFQKMGGFSPTFFHYGEDVNFCQRLMFHSLKIGVCLESRIIHDRLNRPKSKYESLKSQLYMTVLTNLSNPNIDGNKVNLILFDLKSISLNIYILIVKVFVILKLPRKINENRRLSMKSSDVFLNKK